MRIFTGIPLPDEVKTKTREIFRGRLPIPYINTENLHITLNFFGELDSDQTKKVTNIFSLVCAGKSAVDVQCDRVVAHHNRQIHIALVRSPVLLKLQADLEQEFTRYGFRFQNREFYPHIKLANMHIDNVMNRDRKFENFPNNELQALNFRANKIVLYESKLLLHHPKHIPLLEQNLNES